MSDVETPAAAPSPAAETPAPAEKPAPVSVPQSPEDYANWRFTGRLPEKDKPSKKGDPAPSKPSVDSEESESGAPAPEAGVNRRRDNAESRSTKLNREIRELIAKRDQLRAEVEAKPKTDVKAEPSPAPAEASESKRPEKPRSENFKTWEEYEAANDKYLENLADYKAAQKLQEHIASEQQKANQRIMQQRLDEAKTRYGEEAEPKVLDTARTVFSDQKVIPAIKVAIGRSDVIVDALYVMGSDQEELSKFMDLAKQDPLEALRKWFTVEALVRQELGKTKPAEEGETPPRGPDGKFLVADKPPPPRRVSMAPAPAAELNARSSPPVDEVQRSGTAASKSSDPKAVRSYIEAKNREMLAKRRTG